MKSNLETISAKKVIVRNFSGRKCELYNTNQCPVQKYHIQPSMVDLDYIDDEYCYIPENFCLGLAAKYLYKQNQDLFNPQILRCIKYSCGHIFKSGDGNHRMCVLKQLNEEIVVEMIVEDSLCPNCNKPF